MNQEIERRFIVKRLPCLRKATIVMIKQQYIEGENQIRLRSVNNTDFYITQKKGQGLVREEHEMKVTEQVYRALLPLATKEIVKTRYQFPNELVVDIFQKQGAPLVIAEREFPTVEDAVVFRPLSWLGREITQDTSLNSYGLAQPYVFPK